MNDIIEIVNSMKKNIQKLQMLEVVKRDRDTREITDILNDELEEINEVVSKLLKENLDHKIEIRQLKEQIGGGQRYDVKNNVFYTPDGDGPFCPFCSENRGKKNRLRREDSGVDSSVCHFCRVCGNSFSG